MRKQFTVKAPVLTLARLDKAISNWNKKHPEKEKKRNALIVEKMGEIAVELEEAVQAE